MNIHELNADNISRVLSDELKKDLKGEKVFIFPTDTVMNSWTDYLVIHHEESGIEALSFDQFMAWDRFKEKYVSAKVEGKTVVPSLLRKMFVTDFIAKNALKNKEDRLQVIINPSDTYAKEADSFTDYLTKNLVTLHFWKKRIDEHPDYVMDEEDKDYEKLYNTYTSFLDSHNLFEPSWVSHIDFGNDKKEFYIFYPELLEDFTDYKELFSSLDNITLFTLPKDTPNPASYFYNDARSELRQTILEIIQIVNEGKADWSEIALSVPNLEIYRPYIDREFSKYAIPYVIKAGVSLTKNSAGRIFREIYDCYNDNFSFQSVRNLLLDECVPWIKDNEQIIEDLIREGNEMRCVCSVENEDIWERAFNEIITKQYSIINNSKNEEMVELATKKKDYYYPLLNFYKSLKDSVKAFFPSKDKDTFNNLLVSWMHFKQKFLESDASFSEDANNILSRCITELNEIIQIEKKYEDDNLIIPSPFSFFLSEIDKKTYTKQTDKKGVCVFPYRLSACAFFKYQFVIDASQRNLDISYKRLTYLNNTKRGKLGLNEDDKASNAGEVFIKLYAKNTTGSNDTVVHFSASENTFNGFAIPHSLLKVTDKDEKDPIIPRFLSLDDKDYVLKEKNFILGKEKKIDGLSENQKESYEKWKKSHLEYEKDTVINEELKRQIKDYLINRKDNLFKDEENKDDKIKITARGDLENFVPCPRKWLLQNALKIREDSLDTRLMQTFDMGNLNHSILEIFMSNFENKRLPYFDNDKNTFFLIKDKEGEINSTPIPYEKEIRELLYNEDIRIVKDAIFGTTIGEKSIRGIKDLKNCPLVVDTLISQRKAIVDNIYNFLTCLLQKYTGRATDKVTKISGIGNCIAQNMEKSFVDKREKFDYYGKIDFYVLTDDGDFIVIDYKNSVSALPNKKDIHVNDNNILGNFQMPLYFNLIDKNHNHKVYNGQFVAISNVKKDRFKTGTDDRRYAKDELKDIKLENSRKVLEDYANLFIQHIENSSFTPYFSWDKTEKLNVRSYIECRDCGFKGICRTTYQIAGKEITNKKDKEEGQ